MVSNLVPDMIRAVEWIVFYIIEYGYHVVRSLLHYLLALVYSSRSEKVPCVRDPILQMSATELAKEIREGTLTSECVVRAFIDRILLVDPLIHATVDRRFNDALYEAKEVDALVASGTMNKLQLAKEKPLLGVPLTVKILLKVKGLRCTAASLLYRDLIADQDAEAVTLMKKAGAIILATTNSAEVGMNFETNNHVHGTTCNPYDTSKTSGGSSGGESAILAAAGSVIGLGNDMAGSVRVPSMFCGLFAHKPTKGLVPNEGSFPSGNGNCDHLLNTGPMCRYATDLVTTMKILTPPSEVNDTFGREVAFETVKVYYICSFGDMPLVDEVDSEIKEAVRKVASYFETKHRSEIKEANIPLLKLSNKIYMHSLFSNSGEDVAESLFSPKMDVDPTLEILKLLFRQSLFTFGVILSLNGPRLPFIYDANMVEYYRKKEQQLVEELHSLLDERSVLILPTLPFAATYHNEIPLRVASTCYSNIFNPLGLPVTQCPVGFNKRGLPIGVQIVSRQGNDHLSIACAIELEKAFGGWTPPT